MRGLKNINTVQKIPFAPFNPNPGGYKTGC
jgi:hypothetical protein